MNRLGEPRNSTNILEVLPGKLDIKRQESGILFSTLVCKMRFYNSRTFNTMHVTVFMRTRVWVDDTFNSSIPHRHFS